MYYELACPACSTPSQYDLNDYLLMCPACSCTFKMDTESGQKEIFSDHYIVANTATAAQVKDLVLEWLKRLNHKQSTSNREYFVTNIKGLSIPYWVISMEVHTAWKGLVRRGNRPRSDNKPGSEYLIEKGQFKHSYRWAVSGRSNICEVWGMTQLHEPREQVEVFWDGFPLDSTMSRGQLNESPNGTSAYDAREFYETRYLNGMALLGVQINEEEALRRARLHVSQYHLSLARQNVDILVDCRSEVEIAGVQLIHLPFWQAEYHFRPTNVLRHFYRPKEKHVLLEGHALGVLAGEIPIRHRDKLWINAIICMVAAVLFGLLGAYWHGSFLLVGAFALAVSLISAYIATVRSSDPFRADPSAQESDVRGRKTEARGAA